MKKNKIEEILSNFKEEEILEVLDNMKEKVFPLIKTKDLPDPGPEVEIGKENRIAFEDLGNLERIIGRSNLLPASFLEEGAITQKAIARVAFRERYNGFQVGDGWATGFLVSPSLFLTNNHVIPSKSFAKKLKIQFNYQNDIAGNPLVMDEYTFDPDDVFYTNSALDFTLIRVNKKCYYSFLNHNLFTQNKISNENEYTPNPFDPKTNFDFTDLIDIDWYRNWRHICTLPGQKWGYIKLRKTVTYTKDQFLNIIQHPKARRKEIAIQENKITNIFSNTIRYTTDTEPGSSGSPVFNNLWDLIAVHHAAGERDTDTNQWLSNQGIKIDKIVKDLSKNYDGTVSGRSILNELGI